MLVVNHINHIPLFIDLYIRANMPSSLSPHFEVEMLSSENITMAEEVKSACDRQVIFRKCPLRFVRVRLQHSSLINSYIDILKIGGYLHRILPAASALSFVILIHLCISIVPLVLK